MIPGLQKLLITLLVLLQFTAPLVHAHTGTGANGFGVHVPGLESLTVGADTGMISSSCLDINQEDSLVGISTAIQQKNSVTINSANQFFDLPESAYAIVLDMSLLNFSPPDSPSFPDLILSPHSARAPPRQ